MAASAYFAVLLVILTQVSQSRTSLGARPTVHLLTVLPYSTESFTPSWDGGPDVVPAANLAVEMINNSTTILPDYTLELVHSNGGCDAENEARLSYLSEVIHIGTGIVGVIGPGCSASALAALPIANRPSVTLITVHGAGSLLLENRALYPNSVGVLGSTASFADAIFSLIRRAGWNKIAVLFEESREYFFSVYRSLSDRIRSETKSTIGFSSVVYDTYYPLDTIREQGLRIVIVMAGLTHTQNVLCIAHHEQMLYPDYQWILVSREVDEFGDDVSFEYNKMLYQCNKDVFISTIFRGNLFLNYQLKPLDTTAITESGINHNEYINLYQNKVDEFNVNALLFPPGGRANISIWGGIYFDAVWALASALNSVEFNVSLYHRGNEGLTFDLRERLYSLDFEGVSGRVSFNRSTGFVTRSINIFQVFSGEQLLIGYAINGTVVKVLHPEYIPSEFFQSSHASVSVIVVFSIVTAVFTLLVVMTHIIAVIYRKNVYIRASSPKLNHIIYLGCYIWIAAIVSQLIYRSYDYLQHPSLVAANCIITWVWFLPIGYTLMFGMVAARTWRLYRIFAHYLNPGRFISNRALFAFVLVLFIFNAIVALCWTTIDPFQIDNATYSIGDEPGALTIRTSGGCNCKYFFVWFLIIYGFLIALLLITVALSVLTRSIHQQNYTTKFLRVFVYCFALVFGLGLPLYYIISFGGAGPDLTSAAFTIIGLAVIVLVLVLIFMPPIWPLLRDKMHPKYEVSKSAQAITLTTQDQDNPLFL